MSKSYSTELHVRINFVCPWLAPVTTMNMMQPPMNQMYTAVNSVKGFEDDISSTSLSLWSWQHQAQLGLGHSGGWVWPVMSACISLVSMPHNGTHAIGLLQCLQKVSATVSKCLQHCVNMSAILQ